MSQKNALQHPRSRETMIRAIIIFLGCSITTTSRRLFSYAIRAVAGRDVERGEERICEGAITCSISNPPFLLGGDRVKLAY
jgi:hypothetical protein